MCGRKKEIMISRKTYRGADATRVYVKMTHVRVKITHNFDHNPEPLVQDVGGEVVLGGAHGIIAAVVLIHQAITMLERLDPFGEP
jgi:hypothetical protein